MPQDDDPRGLGQRVRDARRRVGMSGRALAAAIGLSPTAINKIELGKSGASIDTVARIAEITGTSIPELFGSDPGSEYLVAYPSAGVLSNKPYSEWPEFLRAETPTVWPGNLRVFVASVAAEMMQLIPDEVPLLAKTAQIGGVPLTEAEWIT